MRNLAKKVEKLLNSSYMDYFSYYTDDNNLISVEQGERISDKYGISDVEYTIELHGWQDYARLYDEGTTTSFIMANFCETLIDEYEEELIQPEEAYELAMEDLRVYIADFSLYVYLTPYKFKIACVIENEVRFEQEYEYPITNEGDINIEDTISIIESFLRKNKKNI